MYQHKSYLLVSTNLCHNAQNKIRLTMTEKFNQLIKQSLLNLINQEQWLKIIERIHFSKTYVLCHMKNVHNIAEQT